MSLDVANIVPWKWDLEKGTMLCDVNRPVELSHDDSMMNEDQLSVPITNILPKSVRKIGNG